MSRIKLGDIANERKEVCKGDKSKYPIVGLEHLAPEEIMLNTWDNGTENTFTKMFYKGDVLFGRRRAYLKKAAVAPFSGICSGDITVIKAKPEKIFPKLLPFIIQNDNLFNFAIEKSAGSLSPRVKWEHLKNYEFELPAMEKQKELAEILWAMNDTIESYKKLISATDELVKSQFIEMFNLEEARQNGWKILSLKDVVEKPLSGEWGADAKDGTGIKVLRTANFTDAGIIDYSEVVTRNIDAKKLKSKSMKTGDILIEKSGGSDTKPVGRVVYYLGESGEYLFNNFTSVIRPKKSVNILKRYLFEFMFVSYWNGSTRLYENKTTGLHNLRLSEYLEGTEIPIPPMDVQKTFVDFLEQSDKSKFELKQALDKLTAVYKRILKENLE